MESMILGGSFETGLDFDLAFSWLYKCFAIAMSTARTPVDVPATPLAPSVIDLVRPSSDFCLMKQTQ